MHNLFDQLAKKVGKGALDASGATIVQYEIARDAQHADLRHDPDPKRKTERARLGLLGRIAAALCLIDIFGHALGGAELRACVAKHFAHWDECVRKARALNKRRKAKRLPAVPLVEPLLWIIASTASAPMLRKIEARAADGWPSGVYFVGDDVFRVGIVVADELPRDRSTILVRIMAAGSGLAQAIADLAALPRDAPERAAADAILVHLRERLGKKPSRTSAEEEFVVAMHKTWEDARIEGELARGVRDVLAVLRVRGLAVPKAVRKRIEAEKDPARLERWHERAILAKSAAEVIDEPS
jgi:hypothetical protein